MRLRPDLCTGLTGLASGLAARPTRPSDSTIRPPGEAVSTKLATRFRRIGQTFEHFLGTTYGA